MTSRTTGDMTDDVSKRMNMSILSEVMYAVVQNPRETNTLFPILPFTREVADAAVFSVHEL